MKQLVIFGVGHLAQALLDNFLIQADYKIVLIHHNPTTLAELQLHYPQCKVQLKLDWELKSDDIFLICVKPQQALDSLAPIVHYLNHALIISVMVAINSQLLKNLCANQRVIRVMPNIANCIRQGSNAILDDTSIARADLQIAEKLFSLGGNIYKVNHDEDIDTFAALLSCSGYFYVILKAMVDTLITKLGFTEAAAIAIILPLIKASNNLLIPSNYATLVNEVSRAASKGGITEQGIQTLTNNQIEMIISNAILSGVAKAQQLAQANEYVTITTEKDKNSSY